MFFFTGFCKASFGIYRLLPGFIELGGLLWVLLSFNRFLLGFPSFAVFLGF